MSKQVEVIASYLPQFFPITENNKWHSEGFTEWTNVAKAKRYFPSHYQPKIPGKLSFYDLRLPETRVEQAKMAKEYGITSFCYWHYWFGNGKRILERQFNEVLESGTPDFPFCLGWANESWYGIDHGVKNRLLIEQTYPSIEDSIEHFHLCIRAFKDKRYTKIDGKPVFMVYKPMQLHNAKEFIRLWRDLAKENGLPGIYFIGQTTMGDLEIDQILDFGFDSVNTVRLRDISLPLLNKLYRGVLRFFQLPYIFSYKNVYKYFTTESELNEKVIPTIIPNWDHTPRTGNRGLVLHNCDPSYFRKHVRNALECVKKKDTKVVFIKSWNEWGEGNYMEPDAKYGYGYLEVFKSELDNFTKNFK